ncbi:MAG: hypothetical protein SynsKO_03410 [Synoicihabitans sp.]
MAPDFFADSVVERLAVASAVGMVLWLPVLATSAALGWFSPAVLGALGWIVTALEVRRKRGPAKFDRRRDGALLAVAALLAIWHVTYRTESIFSGRDQGVYSNHAVHIAETGDLKVGAVFRDMYERQNWPLVSALQAGGYFFDLEQGHIILQFSPTFALYLAQGYGMAGFLGLFSVNPLLAALNAILFFALARRFLTTPWATAATTLFTLNLAQVWIARITLSEVLTQTWILAGLVLMRVAFAKQRKPALMVGALLVASTALVRVDAFLLVIAMAALGAYLAHLPAERLPQESWRKLGRNLAVGVTLLGGTAWLYGKGTSPGYYADFSSRIALMLGIAGFFSIIAAVPSPANLRRAVFAGAGKSGVIRTLMLIFVGLAVYAYFFRPYHEPFANFAASIGWEGRDYRENSLRDLGGYLSPPALAFALVGLGSLLRTTLSRGHNWAVPFLGVWFAYTLLYLYNPYISTDHIWKIRRYIPVVIPGFALLAMIGLAQSVSLIKSTRWKPIIVGAGLISIFGYVGWSVRPLAFTRLNDGAVDLVKRIADHVPENALVVTDVNRPILGPLQLVIRRDTIKGIPEDHQHPALIQDAITRASFENRPIILLSKAPAVSDIERDTSKLSLQHPSMVKTLEPPPREIEMRERLVYVSVLNPNGLGYRKSTPVLRLGANRIYGVQESGFQQQEFEDGEPFRWTTGSVSLAAPWIFAKAPYQAELRVMAAAPGGADAVLAINDHVVWEGLIPETGGIFELPTEDIDWSRPELEIQLSTATFVPAEVYAGATDEREMGLQLSGLVFRLTPPWEMGSWEFGMGSEVRVEEQGLYGVETWGNRPARWTQGHAKFAFEISAEHPPAQISIPVVGGPPSGTDVSIFWNGTELTREEITKFPTTLVVDLKNQPGSQMNELEIVSSTFIPAEREPGAVDTRELGVMIAPVTLKW